MSTRPAEFEATSHAATAWVARLAIVVVVAASVTAWAHLRAARLIDDYYFGFSSRTTDFDQAMTAEDLAATTFVALVAVAWPTLVIALMIWMLDSHRAAAGLRPDRRRWNEGWAIGGWLVPGGNLVIPALVMNETSRVARAPRTDGRVGTAWRDTSGDRLVWPLWAAVIATVVFVALRIVAFDGLGFPHQQRFDLAFGVGTMYGFGTAAAVTSVISAVLAVVVTRRTTAALDHRSGRHPVDGPG